MTKWYQTTVEETLANLETDANRGLTDQEAAHRLEKYGLNELVDRGKKSPWKILLEQFTDTLIVVLIIAAVISAFVGDLKDAIAIIAIVILNGILGFRQEYQAEKAMEALKKLAVPTVRVRRNGHIQELPAPKVVPGDIVLLEAGNLVPADVRLVESINLRIQEAALTGESEPVVKITDPINKPELGIGDRKNLAYMGTVVSYGRGVGVVTNTGMDTELGGIAELLQTASQDETPLQKRLDQLGKGLSIAAGILVVIVFILGLFRGEEIRVLLLTSISMAVAAVPEGLPAVVTIALTLGARRMLRRQALIRKLPAVETLGSVTVICSDKTGTLTENRMTVTILDFAEHQLDLTEEDRRSYLGPTHDVCIAGEPTPEQQEKLREFPALTLLVTGGALCNDALIECDEQAPQQYILVGDPTEAALIVASTRMGLPKSTLEAALPRVAEVPFESERKRMTTIHRLPDRIDDLAPALRSIWNWEERIGKEPLIAFTKGSVDGLLGIAKQVWVNDHTEILDAAWRERIENANARLAQQGIRVLGVAARMLDELPATVDGDTVEKELTFVGLAGMIDPARAEVKDAVATCRSAGIRPIMITGDHPLTARYIANELGISQQEEVITGQELEKMSDEKLEEVASRVSVFARVSPEHKLRIVSALQRKGQIAAMTGDGVNDAPALKKADIGVAMGITGTDVTKEAADMVLLDDNFATIVSAVEEGRTIYDNIRKFIQYTMTSNVGEIWVMLLAPFFGMPLPLLPLQILWINLVTDGLPGLALGVEKPERNIMRRPPYPPNENIFARGLGANVMWVGLLMGLISFVVGFIYWRMNSPYWQTMIFTTLTLSEMGYVMAIRSNRDSLATIGLFSNRAMVGAVALTTVLQFAVVYVPFLQPWFGTMALPLREIMICLALSTSLLWFVELQKWFIRRKEAQIPAAA